MLFERINCYNVKIKKNQTKTGFKLEKTEKKTWNIVKVWYKQTTNNKIGVLLKTLFQQRDLALRHVILILLI